MSAGWPEKRSPLTRAASQQLVAYADGSCLGNPGPGGWGAIIIPPGGEPIEACGGDPDTTNNKMELTAAIEALRLIDPGSIVLLRSDSEYVVKGINEGRKRNKNQELWQRLDAEIASRKVRFEWVRGHAADKWNERADKLARDEAQRIARGGGAGPAPSSAAAARKPPAGEDPAIERLRPLLREDETLRKCAGCGAMFVSKRALYCTLAPCQLKARLAAGPG
jgi:ribonuclease HI